MLNRTPVRDRMGALELRPLPSPGVTPASAVLRTSPPQTQDVVRDLEIGQPNNSETCSEAADGVTRESEGRSWLSLLCPVRQDQPRRHSGPCLCPVPLQQGRAWH